MGTNRHITHIFQAGHTATDVVISPDMPVPIGFLNDLTQATSRDQVLRAYSAWAKRVIVADRCSIAILDDDDHLTITEMHGSEGIPRGSRYHVMETAIGAVYLQQRPVYLPVLADVDSPGCQTLAGKGFVSLAMAPITTGNHSFGVIDAGFMQAVPQPQEMLALLRVIGRCLATQLLVVDQMDDLRVMSITDSLTGARNRRSLYEQASDCWMNWQLSKTPFAFISVDIDHFKRINDCHGHTIGDAVLCAVVSRLQNNLRPGDHVFRMGGEEFGLLMQGFNGECALAQADRLKTAVGGSPIAIGDLKVPVTASFGVTSSRRTDGAFEDILKRSDRALYHAKHSGRNRVILAD